MTAFGRLDFGFKDSAEDDENGSNLEEAYVGMKYGVTSFSFGKQNFASDEFGVEEAYEAPLDEDQFDAVNTDGDDTLRVDIELENLYIVASHEMKASDGSANDPDGIDGEYYDLFVGTEIAGLKLAAAYQQAREFGVAESMDTWGLSAAYEIDMFGLAADYSVTDDNSVDTTLYNVVATADVTSTTGVALGMQNQEEDGSEDVTAWYANVTYKFPTAKNVSVFAEIADTDEDNSDMGFLAGMRVKF